MLCSVESPAVGTSHAGHVNAGSRGFDSHRRHMSERFSDPTHQDVRTQCALSWKIVVSERRSEIAMSLNVGGVVRLIKPAKLYTCTQKKHYKHDEHGRAAPGVRGHGSVPLSHLWNVVTRIRLQQQQLLGQLLHCCFTFTVNI